MTQWDEEADESGALPDNSLWGECDECENNWPPPAPTQQPEPTTEAPSDA